MTITIPSLLIISAILLRIGFFCFGLYQDAHMTVKYTDIDYLVFSDAANYVAMGGSPYQRETYRYTPLLAWILVPNTWGGHWEHFGKFVFMGCDLITGWIILKLLSMRQKSAWFSAIWLLNPMVITISTRGSSESVLTLMIMAFLYFLFTRKLGISAVFLGLAIHFKMYPIIYLPSVLLYVAKFGKPVVNKPILRYVTSVNILYGVVTMVTVAVLNILMYWIYGYEFLDHSYLYHFTRLDHRHNFSVYNVMLYYKSSLEHLDVVPGVLANVEKFAFVPQLLLSGILLPLKFANHDLISCLFMQTFAFVTFNKVITSQYFIWFLIFLPHYLGASQLVGKKWKKGLVVLLLWISTQGLWLFFAYKLEFLGESTFDNGLLFAACLFFISNCWMLGVFIGDVSQV